MDTRLARRQDPDRVALVGAIIVSSDRRSEGDLSRLWPVVRTIALGKLVRPT